MKESICVAWSGIRELSVLMLSLAKEEKWDILAKLERKRNELIHNYFSQPDTKPDSTQMEENIRDVLALDQKILKICQFRKNNISEKLHRFRDSRRAKNAYSQNL